MSDHLIEKFKELSVKAKNENWCITEWHCIARVVYDFSCKDDWRKHIKKPAYKNLNEEQSKQVINIINKLETASPEVINLLNYASLKWRNKL